MAKLKRLRKEKNAKDLDIPEQSPSMFGIDRKLKIEYTQKEHEELITDLH